MHIQEPLLNRLCGAASLWLSRSNLGTLPVITVPHKNTLLAAISIVATLPSAIQFICPDAAAPELQVAAGRAPGLQASLWEQALTPWGQLPAAVCCGVWGVLGAAETGDRLKVPLWLS